MPSHTKTTLRRYAFATLAVSAALVGCGGMDGAGAGDESSGDGDGGDGRPGTSATTGGEGGGTTSTTTTTGTGTGGEMPFVACPYPDLDARFEQVRADLETALAANGVPGGSLAIVCGSEVRTAGVGVVRAGGAPVTGTTRFQLASMTKMLTATAALGIAEAGTVDIASPVATVMPQLGYGDQVTMEHLLTHTSGLPVEFPDYPSDELVPLVLGNAGMSPSSPPGSHWEYNNIGYAIEGALLESATGVPFDELIHQQVLTPIGMTHATMRVADLADDFAYGHSGGSVLGPNDSYYGAPWYGPMGGCWASAEDVAAYAKSLMGHGPLAARLAKQAVVHADTGEWPDEHYGYGLFIYDGVSPPVVYHSGSVQGFLSDMQVVPGADIAAVVLVNDDAWFPGDITYEAIDKFVQLN